MGSVKSAEFYDGVFRRMKKYRLPYTDFPDYPMWKRVKEIIDDLDIDPLNIVDYGCGTGQFGRFLNDYSDFRYFGYDFSAEAIKLARERDFYGLYRQRDLIDPYNWDQNGD